MIIYTDDTALRRTLSAWSSATSSAELSEMFSTIDVKAGQLYAMANAFENELGSMQFAENGLAPSHLMELNDIWKDVMRTEMVALETDAAVLRHQHVVDSDRLRQREDDLVLVLARHEALLHTHSTLRASCAVGDVSGRFADRTTGQASCFVVPPENVRTSEIATLRKQSDVTRSSLVMRERQLSLLVTHIGSSRSTTKSVSGCGTAEEQRLKTLLAERESQLVLFVHELHGLAAAERAPGSVAHDARSRVFKLCAAVRQALGPTLLNDLMPRC